MTERPDGIIVLTAIGAQLTRDMDTFGSQDPYCVIRVGEREFKTEVDEKEGLAPKWNKVFEIEWFKEKVVEVEIMDEDPGSDDLIGKTILQLGDYLKDKD